MTQQQLFACPNCETSLTLGTNTCGRCQIRLTGPDAVRLWQVDQQIGALTLERRDLIGVLTTSAADAAPAHEKPATPARFDRPTPYPAPVSAPHEPKKSMSGQQLLLGLGALMLLSAASFFLLIVWLIVGVAGQALIMGTLTGAAVAGSVWATRRGLPAVAETAAVIATGFLFLDLSAAHALGLAGLDGLSFASYWSGACVIGGALLVGWDRLVPRVRDGVPSRRIFTYRPAAAVLFASAPWFFFLADLPERAWLTAAMVAVVLVNLGCAFLALKVDEPPVAKTHDPISPDVPLTPVARARLPLSATILFGSAALATMLYALTGLVTAYDLTTNQGDRYAAFCLLMLAPVALAVLSTRVGARFSARFDPTRTRVPAAAVLWAVPVLIIPLTDATYLVLVALSVLVAVAVTYLHLGFVKPATATGRGWLRALSVAAYVAQPLLMGLVFTVLQNGHISLRAMVLFDHLTRTVLDPSVLWMAAPAAVWAASSVVGAVHRRSTTWVFIAHLATAATIVAALWDTTAQTWATVLLVAFAATIALACVAVRHGSYALVAPAGTPVAGDAFWAGVDRTAVLFSAIYGFGAVVATLGLSAGRMSLALITIGVLTLVYAAAPTRLPFAYLGSVVISAGTANLMREAEVTTTEAYTAPLVLLLAVIGFIQWSRDKTLPTYLTMGPALAVAMGPSLLTSLGDGDELRLAGVTAAAIIALLVGLTQHWKAPVTAGGLVLIVVAITQGGPLTAYVPGWLILGIGGAALLAAGVAWEKAVTTGRRATIWFSTLT